MPGPLCSTPSHLRVLPRPFPVLLTPVQGVPADLGRRHQIKSPEPHRHHGDRQQQPEAPPQPFDRPQEQQKQRGAGAPHGAALRRPPPAPAPRPGPAPRAHGVPAPAQRLRTAPRPSSPAALQLGAGSCSAPGPQVSPGAEPGSSSPTVLRARLSSPRLSSSQARCRPPYRLSLSHTLPTQRFPRCAPTRLSSLLLRLRLSPSLSRNSAPTCPGPAPGAQVSPAPEEPWEGARAPLDCLGKQEVGPVNYLLAPLIPPHTHTPRQGMERELGCRWGYILDSEGN